jgi:hypothetical protein
MSQIFVSNDKIKKSFKKVTEFERFLKDLKSRFNLSDHDLKSYEILYQNDQNEDIKVKTQEEYERALNYFQINNKLFTLRKSESKTSTKHERNNSLEMQKSGIFELSFPKEDYDESELSLGKETELKSLADLDIGFESGSYKTIDIHSLTLRIDKKKRLNDEKLPSIMIYPSFEPQYKTRRLDELVEDLQCSCGKTIQAEYFTCPKCNPKLFCINCKNTHEHPSIRNLIDLDQKFKNVIQKIISLGWTDENLVKNTVIKNEGSYNKSIEYLISTYNP